MALIEGFDPSRKTTSNEHKPIRCAYRSFAVSGRTLLQLDTGGSEDRENPGKQSQTLQLDVEVARQLVEILRATFPELG